MAPTLRQQQILATLAARDRAAITELAEQFAVSDETIRRDVRVLLAEGYVEKFHGGVRLPLPRTEASFERRLREAPQAKAAIAARAVEHIREGATIAMDNSSTACFLARELAQREPLTILTISLEVAQILSSGNSRHRIILPGGELRHEDRTLASRGAIEFMRQFTPSYFIASMFAASSRGFLDYDLFEAEFKRAMIPLADQTMVLLDSSKFGKPGLIHVCDWDEIDLLVTDRLPDEWQGQMDHSHVLLAQVPDEGRETQENAHAGQRTA